MNLIVNHRTDGEVPMSGIFNHNVVEGVPRVEVSEDEVVHHFDPADIGASDEAAKALGLFPYITRGLCLTNEDDIIQLSNEVRLHWDWIHRHYKRIDLSHTAEVIWDDDQKIMADFPDRTPSFFLFGPKGHVARPDNKRFEATRKMKHKNDFIQFAQSLGVDTPRTKCFKDKSWLLDLERCNFPCMLKISDSVAGLGTVRCEDANELEKNLQVLNPGIKFQIQECMEAQFISVQYYIDERGTAHLMTSTGQFLNGTHHEGNYSSVKFNLNYKPWDAVNLLADAMGSLGLRDWIGIDVAVVGGNNGSRRYLPIECNPRHTGAAYPYYIAQKLKADFWAARTYHVKHKSFAELDLGELEYDPKTKKGWIVFLWGTIIDGKIGMVYCGPARDYKDYEYRLKEKLQ